MKEMLCQLKKVFRLQQNKKSWQFIAHCKKKYFVTFLQNM